MKSSKSATSLRTSIKIKNLKPTSIQIKELATGIHLQIKNFSLYIHPSKGTLPEHPSKSRTCPWPSIWIQGFYPDIHPNQELLDDSLEIHINLDFCRTTIQIKDFPVTNPNQRPPWTSINHKDFYQIHPNQGSLFLFPDYFIQINGHPLKSRTSLRTSVQIKDVSPTFQSKSKTYTQISIQTKDFCPDIHPYHWLLLSHSSKSRTSARKSIQIKDFSPDTQFKSTISDLTFSQINDFSPDIQPNQPRLPWNSTKSITFPRTSNQIKKLASGNPQVSVLHCPAPTLTICQRVYFPDHLNEMGSTAE